jgi:tight adherence protein C
MLLLIVLTIFIASAAFAYFLVVERPEPDLQERLAGKRSASFEVTPAANAAQQRGLPAAVYGMVRRFLPSEILDRVQVDLMKAGNPTSLQKMILGWVAGILVLPAVYAGLIFSQGTKVGTMQLVVLGAMPVLGFYLPRMWLQGRIKKRRKLILKGLPDGIDLITTSVEAGLGIDASLARVAEKIKGPLSEEFRRCLREMSLGRTRRESLREFAARVEIEDVSALVNAIVQAEHTGVSLGQVIRIQAEQLRTRRRQRAEQAAYKAPVKMVIPLVLFIFPAMFVVILGPAAIKMIEVYK